MSTASPDRPSKIDHDPLPIDDEEPEPCCRDAVARYKAGLQRTWEINLALIGNRRFNEGYQQACNDHWPKGQLP